MTWAVLGSVFAVWILGAQVPTTSPPCFLHKCFPSHGDLHKSNFLGIKNQTLDEIVILKFETSGNYDL